MIYAARVVLCCLLITGAGVSGQSKKRAAPAKKTPPPATPPAQTYTELPSEFPIATLDVEGNKLYGTEGILQVSGLKPGQMANKAKFESARDRILATGAFDSVGYRYFNAADGKSFASVFEVVEAMPVFSFRFEDLPVSEEKLRAELAKRDPLFAPKLAATKPRIAQYVVWVTEISGATEPLDGRLHAEVPGELSLVFRPIRRDPNVAEVKFIGNSVLSADVLRPALTGVAVGLPYTEPRLRQLLDASVRPLYEARGRLRVAFPKIDATKSVTVSGVDVLVTVLEGPSFELGKVAIVGRGMDDVDALRAVGDFKTGDIANFTAIADGVERMRKSLYRQGHMKAAAKFDRTIHDGTKKVDVAVTLDPGPRYTFGKLTLDGLDIETEPVVHKMWSMKPGEPFNPDYPEFLLASIREQGIFENLGKVSSRIQPIDGSLTVDVTLYFKGAPPEPPKRPPPLP